MSELTEVTHSGKFDKENTEVEFCAEFEDFTITGTAECDVQLDAEAEPELGIMNDSYRLDDVWYWNREIKNLDGTRIGSLHREELQSCENDIENYFIKLVNEF